MCLEREKKRQSLLTVLNFSTTSLFICFFRHQVVKTLRLKSLYQEPKHTDSLLDFDRYLFVYWRQKLGYLCWFALTINVILLLHLYRDQKKRKPYAEQKKIPGHTDRQTCSNCLRGLCESYRQQIQQTRKSRTTLVPIKYVDRQCHKASALRDRVLEYRTAKSYL